MSEWTTTTSTGTDSIPTTTSTGTDSILSFTTNTTWPLFENFDEYPKGVQDPSTELKYTPKWHIKSGYKNQIASMWNESK